MKKVFAILAFLFSCISNKCIAQNDSVIYVKNKIVIVNNNQVASEKNINVSQKYYSYTIDCTIDEIPKMGNLLIYIPVENANRDTLVLEGCLAMDGISIGSFTYNKDIKSYSCWKRLDSIILKTHQTGFICINSKNLFSNNINFHINAHLGFYYKKSLQIQREIYVRLRVRRKQKKDL